MSKKKPKAKKRRPVRAKTYFRQMLRAAVQSAVSYLLQTLTIAVAVALLSYYKLGALGTVAVLILLLRDVTSASENPPKRSGLIAMRFVQSLVALGLSLVLGDGLGVLGSAVVSFILGSYLAVNAATWTVKKFDQFERWLQNPVPAGNA